MEPKFRKKSLTRLGIVQHLYANSVNPRDENGLENNVLKIEMPHLDEDTSGPMDQEMADRAILGIQENEAQIVALIKDNLPVQWPYNRLELILKCMLISAVYELMCRRDIDQAVIISEYVNMTAAFFEGKEISFMNGLLNILAREVRGGDLQQNGAL